MELRQLEQFLAVAELGSFTAAARRLHAVQSGVSAAVQALERDLGTRLFERDARGARLTPAGSALLPAARATLDAARSARETVTRVAGGLAGEVRLGTMASLDVINLPALLVRLRAEHPGVQVRLRTSPSGSGGLTGALARGDLDAALVAGDGTAVPGMRLTRLLSVPIVALLRDDHPLAGRRAVSLTELAPEPFIDFPEGFGNRRIVDAAFDRLGLDRSVPVEVTDTTEAAVYVRHGLGVSLVPALAANQGGEGVSVVALQRPALPWVLSVATHADRRVSAATRALLDLIPEFTHPLPPPP